MKHSTPFLLAALLSPFLAALLILIQCALPSPVSGDWQDHAAPVSIQRTADKLEMGIPVSDLERRAYELYISTLPNQNKP